MKEKKMVTLSVGKKRKLGALSSMLAKTVGAVSLVAILASCGTSPGYSYTIGGTVNGMVGSNIVLQNNSGDDRSLSANGAFSFPTPLSDAAAYAVTIKTQPTNPSQVCYVSNDSGTINGAPVGDVYVNCVTDPTSITVDPLGQFAYAANEFLNQVWVYTINSDGTLSPLGTPVVTGNNPVSVKVANGFAYVVNAGSNNISVYSINSDGTLSPLQIVGTGNNPVSLAFDSSRDYAYVTNMSDNTIWVYTINSDGTLSPLGTPVGTGNSPVSLAFDSSGDYAYVTNMSDNTIWVYTIANGELTSVGQTIGTESSPVSIVTDLFGSSGQFAYVINENSYTISVYTITDGELTSTQNVATGKGPTSIITVLVGSSEFAYETNAIDGTISAYTITNGILSTSPLQTVSAGTYPAAVTVDKPLNGKFAYVANMGGSNILAYIINPDGTLTPQ
jgi:6-phosphogluconolactonase (cycloisomerase 2 family)